MDVANSATIVQDDFGIPLGYYSAKKWRFFPFGRYAGPISEFARRYQQQYAELFTRAQPIDFGIGYRWHAHESNLLLSVKTAADEPATAKTTSSAEPAAAPKPVRAKKPRPPASISAQPRGFGFFFWR